MPAGPHAPDMGIYLSANSWLGFLGNMNTPFDLINSSNGVRRMPSGVGKRQYRVSFLSFRICLARIRLDQLCAVFFRDVVSLSSVISGAQRSELSIVMGQEIIDTFDLRVLTASTLRVTGV